MKWLFDASTLFDFEAGRGADFLFDLSAELLVPDIIFREELPDELRERLSGNVSVLGLSGPDLEQSPRRMPPINRARRLDVRRLPTVHGHTCRAL